MMIMTMSTNCHHGCALMMTMMLLMMMTMAMTMSTNRHDGSAVSRLLDHHHPLSGPEPGFHMVMAMMFGTCMMIA